MVTKAQTLLLLLCLAAGACKSLNRLSHTRGTQFTVKINATKPDSGDIIDRAAKVIENKANAIGLDVEVSHAAESADTLIVKYYGDQPLPAIRETLLTVYRVELKPVANAVFTVTPYTSEESARAHLKAGQEVLPIKESGSRNGHEFLIVQDPAIIDGNDIRDASVLEIGSVNYEIEFTLKPDAAGKFKDWTGRNIKHYLAIVINDEIQSYPVINGEIADQGIIEGRFSKTSAGDIATSLNAGYLPATMTIVDERAFGN
jgi:preprotein translocase subunit SecD